MEIENTNPLDLDVATVTRQGQQEGEILNSGGTFFIIS